MTVMCRHCCIRVLFTAKLAKIKCSIFFFHTLLLHPVILTWVGCSSRKMYQTTFLNWEIWNSLVRKNALHRSNTREAILKDPVLLSTLTNIAVRVFCRPVPMWYQLPLPRKHSTNWTYSNEINLNFPKDSACCVHRLLVHIPDTGSYGIDLQANHVSQNL